ICFLRRLLLKLSVKTIRLLIFIKLHLALILVANFSRIYLGYLMFNTLQTMRLAPESIQQLEEFVALFFSGLPCTTIICVNLLGSPYATFLQELLSFPSCVHAWILVSRLNSKSQPIVMLLTVDSVLEGDSDDVTSSGSVSVSEGKVGNHWCCPWGSTVVDREAPEFRMILEESYLSSSIEEEEDTKENRALWWTWRKKLDDRLCKLLKQELGRFMVWSSEIYASGRMVKLQAAGLVQNGDRGESSLRVILGGSKYASEGGGAYLSQICYKKGCYIGKAGCSEENKCSASPNESNGYQKPSELAFQLIQEAVNELEGLDSVNGEPIILVLDFEVQNIPILRNQEAYRMPCVWSIFATLEENYHQDQVVSNTMKPGRLSYALCQEASFPLIDPLDAFYLLNPGGDLGTTQIESEKWFRDQNLEGKAGCAPPAEELAEALKSHNLFLYIGHGSDKDINQFAKAMLDGWLEERSSSSQGCAQCKVAEEIEDLSIRGRQGNANKVWRKKLPEACGSDPTMISCDQRSKIGSFTSQAHK
ncbi:hypothetical protein DVH24_033262, partial [Malus domestica]